MSSDIIRASPAFVDRSGHNDTKVSNTTKILNTPDTTAIDIQSIQTNSSSKAVEEFRTYDLSETPARVVEHYKDMRTYQTVEFYDRMAKKYSFENGCYRLVV